LQQAGRALSANDRRVVLSSQLLVYASRANLDVTDTQHLLEKTYTVDLSLDDNGTKPDSCKRSENFWRTQLLTEQTTFAFLDE
jgi:hypothetical protein